MQLSREGSGCGGRSHHSHHHHLWRIVPPMTPPTVPLTASAEIGTITINPADVAIAAVWAELLLLGKPKCYGRGAEALPEGATAGVRRRAPDHYSLAEARPEELTAGVTIAAAAGGESAGATGEGESRNCQWGELRHYRRKIAGITGGGEHRYYRGRRRLAGPERVSAGVTGGESVAVTGEARGGVIGGTG